MKYLRRRGRWYILPAVTDARTLYLEMESKPGEGYFSGAGAEVVQKFAGSSFLIIVPNKKCS